WSTARDLARIGELYLNNGRWGDEQILHPEWLQFVTTPAPAQPDEEYGYGAGFWLLPDDPGVPRDAFAAMGHRGQMLVIVPSEDLVIVRRGYDYSGSGYFDIAGFTRDVVGAIKLAEAERLAAEEAARLSEAGIELTLEERRARRDRPMNQRSRPFELQ
ncbi:MAG: beta-lactamase family protein, partial [Hyphomonadaceae bacterium]|nr:beta-lactamase family protein [Hyphomonadaceae bacterium]